LVHTVKDLAAGGRRRGRHNPLLWRQKGRNIHGLPGAAGAELHVLDHAQAGGLTHRLAHDLVAGFGHVLKDMRRNKGAETSMLFLMGFHKIYSY